MKLQFPNTEKESRRLRGRLRRYPTRYSSNSSRISNDEYWQARRSEHTSGVARFERLVDEAKRLQPAQILEECGEAKS